MEHPPTNLTTMFLNVVIRMIMLPRNLILKFTSMTLSNENKLLCYESYLYKMGFDTVSY